MLGSPAGPGGTQRGLWPLAPVPASAATSFTTDAGFSKCGVYSLFPGGPSLGNALYSHARTVGQFTTSAGHIQQSTGNPFYHKDSLFSAGYTFGAPTPPPGSPYSPVPVTAQLELFAKGFNATNSIIIQQQQHHHQQLTPQPEYLTQLSPSLLQQHHPHHHHHQQQQKKVFSSDAGGGKRCEEKCCAALLSPVKKSSNCSSGNNNNSNGRKVHHHHHEDSSKNNGCSRTNPIEWGSPGGLLSVKNEPGATPCQVAEISTSVSSPSIIKLEVTSPKTGDVGVPSNVPLGIVVSKQHQQRFFQYQQQQEVVGSLPPAGLLTTVNAAAQIKEVPRVGSTAGSGMSAAAGAGMAAASATGGAVGGGAGGGGGGDAVLQCGPDDRTTALAGWPLGGAHGPSFAAAAAPTLWQYPAPIPMEPMVPLPVPMPPVGFQLVRDPTTGGLLLLPTTGIEPIQQAVVWPSYHQPPSVLIPPLPPPPLQLLSGTTHHHQPDFLTSTTLHQQTHCSTRLVAVTTDGGSPKKSGPAALKHQAPGAALVKIENDTVEPIVTTTHLIYQHPGNGLVLTASSAQGTSPAVAACLTPPPEVAVPEETVGAMAAVPEAAAPPPVSHDASNQTDTPICSDDDTGVEVEDDNNNNSNSNNNNNNNNNNNTDTTPDLSGLELLSNSIAELENQAISPPPPPAQPTTPPPLTPTPDTKAEITPPPPPLPLPPSSNLGGLDLLCALAEQRILEAQVDIKKEDTTTGKKSRKRHSSSDETSSNDEQSSRKRRKLLKQLKKSGSPCQCPHRSYKSAEEVKKFIASKSEPCCHHHDDVDDWTMNEMELEMRMRLADLQRQYREKRKELSKLKPRKRKRSKRKSSGEEVKVQSPAPIQELEGEEDVAPLKPIKQSDRIINDYNNDLMRERAMQTSKDRSSSKKRKFGVPTKRLLSAPETIVAKKPKKTNNFVSYLLAAKEKYQTAIVPKDTPKSNIRPKLKAEATVKSFDDVSDCSDAESNNNNNNTIEVKDAAVVPSVDTSTTGRCTLRTDHLEIDKLRVLTAMGGLFYAGHLNAVEPPDVYSITLDGERGNRPHIMSREEILRDAIVEVAPKSTAELETGTRLCAYWSQQYRCLYPGSVAEPGTPDPALDSKFVAVEFDDGDSGRIAIEDIRLLPPDYPIIEYDPNPLLSLSKRKRRASTSVSTEDRRPKNVPIKTTTIIPEKDEDAQGEKGKENEDLINKPTTVVTNDTSSTTYYHHAVQKKKLKKKKKKRDKVKECDDDANNRKEQKLVQQLVLLEQMKYSSSDSSGDYSGGKVPKKRRKHKSAEEVCSRHNKKHHHHHKKHHHRKHHKKHHKGGCKNVVNYCVELVDGQEEEEKEVAKKRPEAEVVVAEVPEVEMMIVDNVQSESKIEEVEDVVVNPEDEVTMEDIEATQKSKKFRDRQESCESRSKMSAFLPARQLWGWSGKGYKRSRAKGRSRKQFFKTIQRGKETITVGDSAVFLSTGRPDRPYIGKIEAMWEMCGTMVVKVKWFYHPEETIGCPADLRYPGALFESPHVDENDVQTISHKCEVLPLDVYTERLGDDPRRYAAIYDNNDIYYLAGHYDPTSTTLKMEPNIPIAEQ